MIAPASAADLPQVRRLLEQHGLPLDGVGDLLATMVVAREAARVVGVAALEVYAEGGLLRSVAVDPGYRGRGLGHDLTEAVLRLARARGLDAVFLLTTTAERYFPRFGFQTIPRHDVPSSVQASVEFGSACPASAVVMRRRLTPGP